MHDPAAGDNEIDQPLLDLLQQNIAAAKAANQEKPAEFMQKVHERVVHATFSSDAEMQRMHVLAYFLVSVMCAAQVHDAARKYLITT